MVERERVVLPVAVGCMFRCQCLNFNSSERRNKNKKKKGRAIPYFNFVAQARKD